MPIESNELVPHLLRTEFKKMVAVLCRHFGIEHMELAEDIAGDTFLLATETWPYKGVPANPSAWLYNVAKNKAKNHLQRAHVFEHKIVPDIKSDSPSVADSEPDLSPQNIYDSQLQMMFAVCHPSISPEAQVGLSLRILCGFGIEEIADAFLTNKETITKRLFRAKEKLRQKKIAIEMPDASAIEERLAMVLQTIYLLFSEGYYSSSNNEVLRRDLCLEAMYLCNMLTTNTITNKPQVNALMALMCFHASRFDARTGKNGEPVLYEDQDTSRWNMELISRGSYFLKCAATGSQASKYHLEAAIAYWSTQKEDTTEKWEQILQLYNRLLQIEYSPIAALNRTYALAKANGRLAAITEAEKLNLTGNHFYHTLLGVLYTGIDNAKALMHLGTAHTQAKTATDKQTIQAKIDALQFNPAP